MLKENKNVFDIFRKIHDEYQLNPDLWQKTFNEDGAKIQEIVKDYENRLCSNTERGMYNKYSGGLAEKFQNEIRKAFPMFDHIGIKTVTTKNPETAAFNIKKIKL
ncbi:hypothetical protein A3A76_05950 [Candidatus Woesebacteria bacterium RIFCSPLOWO2_01_FULL_39_23]|nr:MAG: hypothetical protein A3E41_04295 [Candidatus Woesebacteria bacterium RIFCSPHIGHO2_12_FULL_38_9]OGM63219.1 MAG: hypothetical protein A3A76_05950 [Candidatus Woesebacteria bacterium RIFCSPLOWO2_01_FULL_39_23]